MTTHLNIDLVSDVSCPWCAIGLQSLLTARAELAPELTFTLRMQPFELNPDMAPEGESIVEHLGRKYGSTPEQQAQTWQGIQARGQAVGFDFATNPERRIYNTFDAHRLLHWAGLQSAEQQLALKLALLRAYFTEGKNPSDHAVLQALAVQAGLNGDEAAQLLASGQYADEVRRQEGFYQRAGVSSVPAFIVNHRHLISGGQPPEVFVQALRQIAAEPPEAA
jgi:predicted DsbA family dithiol-disulfide isomerase